MRLWHQLRELLRTLFRGRRVSRDLDDELADWVETLTARHAARGLAWAQARRQALLDIGGTEQVKEEARSMRNGSQLESTLLDVRYAWRALRRTPAFTVAAVLTFALGIGATTAIFSVVKTVLIEPLPYRDAGRLMFVWADLTDLGYPHAPLAGPELAEFQQQTTSFERLGGIWATNATLDGAGDPQQLRIATVTADFFPLLGVEAALGRVLSSEHFNQAVTPLLLSHALWVRSFGADPQVVGRSITLNGRPATVAGVMPERFTLHFPNDAAVPPDLEAWAPGSARLGSQPRGQQYLRIVGRLKPEVSIAAAEQDVAAVGRAIIAANPGSYTPGSRFYGVSMQEDTVRPVRPALLAIFAGVLILLVIACVNIAGLLIVRAAARRKETSMRLAMGASRSRLLRQCLADGVLLSTIGGVVGVAVAWLAVRALAALAPASLGRVQASDLDAGVLAFAAAASMIWGIGFSLMPWREVRRADLLTALQHGGRSAGTVLSGRVRRGLVVAQVALGMVLVVGAALLARTFDALMRLDPGFEAAGAMTFRVAPSFQRHPPPAAFNTFHRDLIAGLQALPGVTAVGTISHLPYDNLPNWAIPYLPTGETDGSKAGLADSRTVSPGFLEAAGARLLAGRFFAEHDTAADGMPVVIDELMARRLFGDDDPLRRTLQIDPGGSGRMTAARIIGVVGHLRHRSLTEPGREQIFLSARLWFRNPASYVVRAGGDPASLMPAIRDAVRTLDAGLPVYDVRPLDDYVRAALAPSRFTAVLAVTFAAVALVLAAVGVYGVVAYAASRRTQEFGIRVALGAESREIVGLVLRSAAALSLAGLAIGGIGAAIAARLLSSQLFEVGPYDPLAFAIAIVALGAAALVASWLPARRAAAVAPMDVLRDEA